MKLHLPQFERALKSGVREAIKSDPALRREYRRARRFTRRRPLPHLLVRAFPLFVLMGVIVVIYSQDHDLEAVLMLINLSGLCLFVLRMDLMQRQSEDVSALLMLPTEDRTSFRWEWSKYLRRFIWVGIVYFCASLAVGYTMALSLTTQLSLALSVSLLATVTLLALNVQVRLRWPRLQNQIGCLVLSVPLVVGIAFYAALGHAPIEFLGWAGPWFNRISPAAWPLALFRLVHGDMGTLVFLFPMLLLIGTLPSALRQLEAQWRFREVEMPEAPDIKPVSADAAASGETLPASPQIMLAGIEQEILSGQPFSAPEWERGPLERLHWCRFSEREKALALFCMPLKMALTARAKVLYLGFLGFMLLALGASAISLIAEYWVLALGGSALAMIALANVGDIRSVFRPVNCGAGVLIPLYAAYPATYRELCRFFGKMLAAQMLIILPVAVASVLFVNSLLAHHPTLTGAALGLRGVILAYGAIQITHVFAFSAASHDTTRFRLRSFAILIIFSLLGCVYFALGVIVMMVFVDSWAWMPWLLCGIELLLAWLFIQIYGWFHNSPRHDLMCTLRQS